MKLRDILDFVSGRTNRRFAEAASGMSDSLMGSLQKLELEVSEAVRHSSEQAVTPRPGRVRGEKDGPLSR